MRRWIRLAAQLYPRRWRARYGEEFDALLEDAGGGPTELVDVLRGAMKMQLTRGSSWKLAAAMALAGALVAAVVSFRVAERYVSTAVVRVAPPRDAPRPGAIDTVSTLQEILSRSSLAELIQRPSLNLYPQERRRLPMEDVIEQMRNRHIRVRWSGTEMLFSFDYPDPVKAQAVTRALVSQFTESERMRSRFRTQAWHEIWPQSAVPPAETIEVLDPASLPVTPIAPNRLAFVAAGLAAGLALGLLAAVTLRHPKRSLRMAGFAVAGCALGVAISYLLPVTYTSTAVMRITPPIVPATPDGATTAAPPAERLQQIERQILSRGSLAAIIKKPSLDLYREERAKAPLEEVVETMRNRSLSIRALGAPNETAGAGALLISFSYRDAGKAQAVVRELVTQFLERNVIAARAGTKDLQKDDPVRKIAELESNLEVLDPPSFPQSPVFPNRIAVAVAGIALGLTLGTVTLLVRRSPEAGRKLA